VAVLPPLLLLRSDRVVIALVSCRYLGRLRPPPACAIYAGRLSRGGGCVPPHCGAR
jgi:hypothetical protein